MELRPGLEQYNRAQGMSWATASYAEDNARRAGWGGSCPGPALHVHQWDVLYIVDVLVNASENLHIASAACCAVAAAHFPNINLSS